MQKMFCQRLMNEDLKQKVKEKEMMETQRLSASYKYLDRNQSKDVIERCMGRGTKKYGKLLPEENSYFNRAMVNCVDNYTT